MGKSKVHSQKASEKQMKQKAKEASLNTNDPSEALDIKYQEERIKGVFAALESCFVHKGRTPTHSFTDFLDTVEKNLDIKDNQSSISDTTKQNKKRTKSFKNKQAAEEVAVKKEEHGKKATRNSQKVQMPTLISKKRKTHPVHEPFEDELPDIPERIQPSRRVKETKSALKDDLFEFETAAVDEEDISETPKSDKKATRRRSKDDDSTWHPKPSYSPKSKMTSHAHDTLEPKNLRRRKNSVESEEHPPKLMNHTDNQQDVKQQQLSFEDLATDQTCALDCKESLSMISCEEQLPPSPQVKQQQQLQHSIKVDTNFAPPPPLLGVPPSYPLTDLSIFPPVDCTHPPSLDLNSTQINEIDSDLQFPTMVSASMKEGKCDEFIDRFPTFFISLNEMPELEQGLCDDVNLLPSCMQTTQEARYQPTFTPSDLAELSQSLPDQSSQEVMSWYESLWC